MSRSVTTPSSMLPALLTLILAASPVFGFGDSYPVAAWSTIWSPKLSNLAAQLDFHSDPRSVVNGLLSVDELCQNDVVIVVSQPQLHASDLRNVERSSPIYTAISHSTSSSQIPYVADHELVEGQNKVVRLDELFADGVVERCGYRRLDAFPQETTKNTVVSVKSKDALRQLESYLPTLAPSNLNYLILLTGSPSEAQKLRTQPARRQARAPTPTSKPGILKRYQLLSPPLIIGILIVVLVYIPLIFLGVNALAGIQTPRISAMGTKSVSSEKKNQ